MNDIPTRGWLNAPIVTSSMVVTLSDFLSFLAGLSMGDRRRGIWRHALVCPRGYPNAFVTGYRSAVAQVTIEEQVPYFHAGVGYLSYAW
ncbi:hypothetical protein GCM10007979_38960 [Nocardioides albus]|nr:hypothetical protein GCM10007979_38960 [Nocardioides albus]